MDSYSLGCIVDRDQVPRVGGSFASDPAMCMNTCIRYGGNVFDASVSGCSCYKRDMTKAPMPYIDNVGTDGDKMSCGCIESASG